MRATAGRVAVLLAASGLAIAATPRTMTEAALREHVERHDLTHDRRDMSLDAATAWDDDDDDLGVGGGFGTRDGTRDRTARLDDVDDDPKPLDARACAPRASDLERLGWKWNAWKYAPRFVPAEAVAYSVGVGRDITFDAALLAAHPTLEMHAFDNTPVASEFVHALGLAGGVPRAWTWHRLLLAPRDARSVALALPEGRADSYAPVADAGESASSPVTLPARPFWRIVARLDTVSSTYSRWTSRAPSSRPSPRWRRTTARRVRPCVSFSSSGTSDSSRTAGVKIQIRNHPRRSGKTNRRSGLAGTGAVYPGGSFAPTRSRPCAGWGFARWSAERRRVRVLVVRAVPERE